jgi:hypothetical protein
MTLHSIEALWEGGIGDAEDSPDVDLLIFYTFDKGYREVGPSYASGGEPGQPPTVELDHVEREIDGKWITVPEFNDWAMQWLDGYGHDKAIENALCR